jgi:hypothetical protein
VEASLYNFSPQKIEIVNFFKKLFFGMSNSLGKHPMNSSSVSVGSFFLNKNITVNQKHSNIS